ncbi:L-serine ammonia-lyase [Acinetobacter pittii]|uniref:L-serine ammonia-lyase n=1 Tax=Acinetobacter pittii TaxID=48296 RepID=UPI00197F3F25|nr:L-serine ammonia-lyase [Acinetobacter pittii]MBN6523276.1 L-serine ammonia-lyase [Acinetobacter pittii]
MSVSVFDLFKIGIGPSSSHTVGPMRAAFSYIKELREIQLLESITRIEIILYGSLSSTGIGHATDKAVLLGLMGFDPETINIENSNFLLTQLSESNILHLNGTHPISFNYRQDLVLIDMPLAYHPNAMTIKAFSIENTELYINTYYSVGGGFILDKSQINCNLTPQENFEIAYPFKSAHELLELCKEHNLSISEIMLENEKFWRSEEEINQKILEIWQVMQDCIQNGLKHEGILPGGLNVKRRAKKIYQKLKDKKNSNLIVTTFSAMEWVNLFALAVNEENAAGGRVVTAPTNGAAGIIPAVLYYYTTFSQSISEEKIVKFFLSAAAVGILCKLNASISGAEVGCQGEVGSACAMAAAGLAEILDGTPAQVEHAAEIGLEHNLGLTCDPVGGLVQIPCIERNAIAAVKAINAAQMALHDNGEHFISLDKVILTMKATGKDMSDKYKETSKGGLAVNAIEC